MKVRPFIRLNFSRMIAAGVASSLLTASAANYTITDLGTLGGDYSSATDINGAGQIVGVARTVDSLDRAFLWQNGLMTDLGTLGGTNSHAAAINEAGRIVGWAESADGRIRACLFGIATNMDLSGGHAEPSFAADINDLGRVVGWTETPVEGADQPRPIAVIFGTDNPGVQAISLWWSNPYRGKATAVNNQDRIAGWTGDGAWLWGPHDRATVWEGPGASSSTRYGIDSQMLGINAAGQLVGENGYDYVQQRATFWTGTNQLSLGSLALESSSANSINNAGQIVGSAKAYRFGFITNQVFIYLGWETNGPPPPPQIYQGYIRTRHAFLWQGGVMSDLNDLIPTNSDWELTEATSINDAGQIVGAGRFNGQNRAYLLTPASNPNQVPFVRLLAPADGDWVAGTNLALHAEASDPDGQVQKVEFFAQRVSRRDPQTGSISVHYLTGPRIGDLHPPGYLGAATNLPFTLNVTNLAAGNYFILAKATDDQGATACASEVLLRVNAPPRLHLVRGQFAVPYPPPPSTDNTVTLRLVNSNEEMIYDIEASRDLINWTNVGFINPLSSSLNNTFQISEPTNSSLFYRAVSK